jgi:ADP-ribosyl-[dinitrogen reductase] hydrolase
MFMDRFKRILGGLFGVACGDALGGTLEFLEEDEGKEMYGYHTEIIGGGLMKLKPGEITDDTVMTICVAKGMLENPHDPIDNIGKHFIQWHLTNPKDEGITVRTALDFYLQYNNWEEASKKTYDYCDGRVAGNGTLMRCIPPALYYRDYDRMVRVTIDQSDMTHYDKEASEACILYNTIVFRYMKDEGKITVLKDVLKDTEYKRIFDMKKDDLNPSGYVVDSMFCALWCFINHDNVEDIICEAVNLYGDPDTIGAIAGGLAGVYYGFDEIPERWKDKILVKDELYDIAEKINHA